MHVIIFVVIFQICQVIYTGCLRGAGDTLYTAVASMISVTIVRTVISYLFASTRFKQGKWTQIKI
uniref:MATE family efflux transporter n=1 Tax=Acetatifactor sp. TaxID=1872090 RepID=UPI00405623E5